MLPADRAGMEWLLKRGRGLLSYCLVGYILDGVQPAVRLGLRLTDGGKAAVKVRAAKEDAASVASAAMSAWPIMANDNGS
ncbi:hypothetical protein NEUTE2DRAFT_72375 [Neurospora tetrasperma FGSC 2509]|nr:hypothetical protein NEUTE2DRAFT_72375 [Neurospora tetrasperma FGSC 2509]